MAGLLRPRAAYDAGQGAARTRSGCRCTSTPTTPAASRAASVLAAVACRRRCGRRRDRCHERADLAAEPGLDRRGAALRAARQRHRSRRSCARISAYWEQVRRATPPSRATSAPAPRRSTCTACPAGSTPTCASRRARSASTMRAGRRSPRAYAEVNDMFGDIVKVTPTSKVVGDLALLMVTAASRARRCSTRQAEIAFPESVVQFFRGDLGQPYGGFPPELQRKVLNGAQPLSGRPGAALPPVDLERRARAHPAATAAAGDRRGPRLLPHVSARVARLRPRAAAVRRSGHPADAGVLLRHGAGPGDQRRPRARQDAHRALHRRSEPHEDGTRTVFFELNGQPRSVRVPDTSQVAQRPPPRKIEPGNAASRRRADAGRRSRP